MYILIIGWAYVALMMAVAEATNPAGTVLGAVVTFVLYGVLPVSIAVYLMATPARKRRLREREAAERAAHATGAQGTGSAQPGAGGEAPAAAVAPVREEP